MQTLTRIWAANSLTILKVELVLRRYGCVESFRARLQGAH